MGNIFYLLLEQPLINILFLLYVFVPGHDFGVAVILLTIIIRALLWPLMHKQLHSQRKLTKIQPEIKKINEKYKGKPQEQQKALLELYKEKEVNPGSSCLLALAQMPILFALFYVFRDFGNDTYLKLTTSDGIMRDIYLFIQNLPAVKSFVVSHPTLDASFLGIVNLAKPSIALAVVAGALQFWQSRMLLPKNQEKDASSMIGSQMTYFMPIMIVLFAIKLPAVLPFYWGLTTIFAIIQQKIVIRGEVEEMEEIEEGKIVNSRDKNNKLKNKPKRKKHANKRRRS